MTRSVYEWAVEFVSLGIAVFPVGYRSKRPKLCWEQYRQKLPGTSDLRRWFQGGSLHNYAVVAGWQDLLVLDFDDLQKYYVWNLWALEQPKDSPAERAAGLAFRVRTARGMHVYLQVPGRVPNAHIDGLDIKKNGYVLGPGSTHPSGAFYTARGAELCIPQIPALDDVLPPAWLDELRQPPEPQLSSTYAHADALPDPFELASHPLRRDLDLVTQIRERHRLQDYLKNLKRSGQGWYMAACPFHDDRHPSFWVDDRRQIGNCLKCRFPRPLDVINLYALLHGISCAQAITALARG
jgi:hypothetical protein